MRLAGGVERGTRGVILRQNSWNEREHKAPADGSQQQGSPGWFIYFPCSVLKRGTAAAV